MRSCLCLARGLVGVDWLTLRGMPLRWATGPPARMQIQHSNTILDEASARHGREFGSSIEAPFSPRQTARDNEESSATIGGAFGQPLLHPVR
eukprot:scaffold109086_cov39-Prasinocladus_malaysianus.AAC.1